MLLPDPDKFYKNASEEASKPKKSIFFEQLELDQIARSFIGNNQR
jgi:hypothetical protein